MLVTSNGGAHIAARMRSVAHVGSQTETIRLAIGFDPGVTPEHIRNTHELKGRVDALGLSEAGLPP